MTTADEIAIPNTLRTVWDPDKTDLAAELEAGGYTAAIAGEDFSRLVSAARSLLTRAIRGLVITGEAGSGKTLAASILAKGVLSIPTYGTDADGNPSRPIPPTRIDCSNINFMQPEALRGFVTLAGCAQNWWLEDVGVEAPVNEYGVKYDPIATFFYNLPPPEQAPDWCPVYVLATTNLTLPQIAERYGDRTASRLCDRFGWLKFKRGDVRHDRRTNF